MIHVIIITNNARAHTSMWTYIWHLIVFDRRKTSHTKLFWMKMIKYTHSHSRCVCANKRDARASTQMCQNNHMASNRSADLLNERNVSNNLSNYFNAHVCVSNARFILKIDAFSTKICFQKVVVSLCITLYVDRFVCGYRYEIKSRNIGHVLKRILLCSL